MKAEVRSWWEERVEKDPIPSHEATRNGAYAGRVSFAFLKHYVDDIEEAWDYYHPAEAFLCQICGGRCHAFLLPSRTTVGRGTPQNCTHPTKKR